MADKTNDAWKKFLAAHPQVVETIEGGDVCEVSAEDIKAFREPRLMTKHDSRDSVPRALSAMGANVLSASRRSYYLGRFDVFERFPDMSGIRPDFCALPPYETLDIEHISSESNAINALVLSHILDDFLGESEVVQTFNGRMGTGCFGFDIDVDGTTGHLNVKQAQLEIDAGFECDNSVIIMEAKNVIHQDFNVRQLYYPFRRYRELVDKPIRLVFSQYTNLTYNLFEYRFADPDDFGSIQLLKKAAYTFEDDRVTADDVARVWRKTGVLYSDKYECGQPAPFPQADRIDRIFALLEFLSDKPDGATTAEIVEFMGLVERQASYYPSAGVYLRLFERPRNGLTVLTGRAVELVGLKSRRDRLLMFAVCIFEHRIFHDLYGMALNSGTIPTKSAIERQMSELQVLGGDSSSTRSRRALTVSAWLKWLFDLPDDDQT